MTEAHPAHSTGGASREGGGELSCVLMMSHVVSAQVVKDGFIKTSDGTRIHYMEAGEGTPIVFIPGWRMPDWIWQRQIDDLSKKYRVIAVDPRSQGESDKPAYGHLPETRAGDYKQLVDQLGLKQPVLVGWSMGCGELLSYVEQFGEDNILGLVLVDGLIPANKKLPTRTARENPIWPSSGDPDETRFISSNLCVGRVRTVRLGCTFNPPPADQSS